MPRTISGKDAVKTQERVNYTHGALRPVVESYYKWADDKLDANGKPIKDANGKKIKIAGTGGEIEYEVWVKLPTNKRGSKYTFEVDPRVLNPSLEFSTIRGVMVGFDSPWGDITVPSIKEVTGADDESIKVFLDRAYENSWYIEAERVPQPPFITPEGESKPQDTLRFIRMTQDLNVLHEWNLERYPKHQDEVPPELVTQAKAIFTKMAKGNPDKFATYVNDNEDLSPYLPQLAEMAKGW